MPKFQITAPRKSFTGVIGRVAFVYGTATVDTEEHSAEIAYFRRQGYTIGAPDPDDDAGGSDPVEDTDHGPDPDDADDIPGLPRVRDSRGAWADHAEGMGLDTEGRTKDQIISAVRHAHDG